MNAISADAEHAYHGEEIALTTLVMAERQGELLERDQLTLRVIDEEEIHTQLSAHMDDEQVTHAIEACRTKGITQESTIALMNQTLAHHWPAIREKLAAVHVPKETLLSIMASADIHPTPAALGWDDETLKRAVAITHLTRDRFTALDVMALTS